MKHILFSVFILAGGLSAQSTDDPFVSSLNAAWSAKNYTAIETSITSTMQQRPNDLTVLYASYHYYLMVRPDLAKLTDAATRIKVIADASNKPAIKAVSAGIQENMPRITAEGVVQPDQATLDQLHVTFDDEFPLISLGKRLQALLQQ